MDLNIFKKKAILINQKNLTHLKIFLFTIIALKNNKKFCQIDGIISIFQFGTVHAVGNSDIDLCFIIDEKKINNDQIHFLLKSHFSWEEKYLLYEHAPMIINENLFKDIQMIRPATSLTYLCGRKISYSSFILDDLDYQMIQLVELISTVSIPFYFKPNERDKGTRIGLQVTNAIKYPLYIYEQICIKFNEDPIINISLIQNFLNRNNFFRKNNLIFPNHLFIQYLNYANKIYIHIVNRIKLHLANIIKEKLIKDDRISREYLLKIIKLLINS